MSTVRIKVTTFIRAVYYLHLYGKVLIYSMRGSRNFRQGGPGQSEKISSDNLTTFFFSFFSSPQLILPKSNGQFQRNLSFSRSQRGPTFSRGSNFFQGGSNCLFPIETHITCHFPGGSGPPAPPPLDPHLYSASYRPFF